MKTQTKSLLVLSVLSIFSLAGCNAIENIVNPKDDETGENLPYSSEQAKNRLLELGETSGFEITYQAYNDDEEIVNYTFGMKDNIAWQDDGADKEAIKRTDSGLDIFEYDSETQSYVQTYTYSGSEAVEVYNSCVTSYTAAFFMANTYDGMEGYHKVKDLTFAGRSATEYRYDLTVYAVEVHLTTVIDKEIGITLFWDASGKTYDGEGGSATFKVFSFKTGSQVVAPVIG